MTDTVKPKDLDIQTKDLLRIMVNRDEEVKAVVQDIIQNKNYTDAVDALSAKDREKVDKIFKLWDVETITSVVNESLDTRAILEAVDFAKAFSVNKDMFPDYKDIRDFILKTSNGEWTILDIESAMYQLDAGKTIEGGSPKRKFLRDPNNYFVYLVNGEPMDCNKTFCELLLFAAKNGSPLHYIVNQ